MLTGDTLVLATVSPANISPLTNLETSVSLAC